MQRYQIRFHAIGKKLCLIVFILITAKIFAQQATPDSSFHIYILMGQSNMAGRGYLTDSFRAEHNDSVLALNQNLQWVVAHHPLHFDKPADDGVGPGLMFGIKMLQADSSVKIGLVPCAVGGTAIEKWKPGVYDDATGTHPYDDAVQRIKEAMKAGVVCGVIWHQGESNCTAGASQTYMPQLLTLIDSIRRLVKNPYLPFIAGQLGQFYQPHDTINNLLDSLPQKSRYTAVVSSAGLTDRGDKLHFDAPSAEILGTRYATAMQQIQNTQSISVSVNPATGQYNITSNFVKWTFSGSVGQALSNVQDSLGSDEAGDFEKLSFTWNNGNNAGAIRWYKNSPVVIFTQRLPNGGNISLDGFPNFTSFPDSLHPFSYGNTFFAPPTFGITNTSTPWLLFDNNNNACVISPASHFMVATINGDAVHSITSTINQTIQNFPAGFSYSTIMVMNNGIGNSWDKWGAALRALYHRQYPDKDADTLLKSYGYWTDNGADYYYNYDTTVGYQQTLLNLMQYYRQQQIPIGYMQLDSWWYEKTNYDYNGNPGSGYKNSKLPRGSWNLYGGLYEYTADNFVFPSGLSGFHQQLGIPVATHNRWIDNQRSPYKDQYTLSGIMSPDPNFWNDIMSTIKSAGVTCYEQDWLSYIYQCSPDMQNTLTTADMFTDNMANAAAARQINLQYCMAMPRYFLQGLKYNDLTTIRTSQDIFKPNKWQDFIFTSQLAYEIGAMPWSDVFKSNQLNNMILSVLSSGPVGTGDAIGKENKNNIMLACRADGQIVRPDVPILPLDKMYTQMAAADSMPILSYTYTKHNSITTGYLFAFCNDDDDAHNFSFSQADIGMSEQSVVYNPLAKTAKEMSAGGSFSDVVPDSDYVYYIIAPVTTSGIAFLGDSGKIAATGKKRITDIEQTNNGLKVTVLFASNETQVTIQGYCKRNVRANIGNVRMNQANHVFNLTVFKPNDSDHVDIIFTPTSAGNVVPGAFSTTWKTDNTGGSGSNAARQIQFNATGSNFSIHWEDMFNSANTGDTAGANGANTITFPSAGTYLVSISPGSGTFTGFTIGTATPQKLLSVEQWGNIVWNSFNSAYSGATNLAINATDTPILRNVTDMTRTFNGCSSLTTNDAMNNWHTDAVTSMMYMFNGASLFNQNISNWNTADVTNMSYMFQGAKTFNQPLGNWNTGNVTVMNWMFNGAAAFNQPLGSWNTGKVTNIGHIFQSDAAFNQDISNWDLSNATNMVYMFYGASSFNQNIGSWNTSKATNMVSIFQNASSFNQNLGKWDLRSITPPNGNDGSLVNMLGGSGLDCDNYSKTLRGWAADPNTPDNLRLDANRLSYDSVYAKAAHDSLINIKNWTINGDQIGHCSVTTPVTIVSFTGALQHGIATLQWHTGVEINFNHFEIESSAFSFENTSFKNIGNITSKGSGSSYILSTSQSASTMYYRLKTVDNDGASTYSNIISLSQNNDNQLKIYPNPATDQINITTEKTGNICIYNTAGKILKMQTLNAGYNQIDISSLSPGIYFCEVNGQKSKLVKK